MARGRKKGVKKYGGRTAGTPNRTTQQAKELLESIMYGQLDNIHAALNELKNKDNGRYLDACSKMLTYVLPKKADITSDDKPIKQLPTIIIKKHIIGS